MKRLWYFIVCLVGVLPLVAQTNGRIKELQTRRGALQEEIAASEQMLLSTKKDVSSQLADLNVLTGQINARKRLVAAMEADVKALDSELVTLQGQLAYLEKQLKERKQRYANSVKYMYRNRSVQEKLLFIFSADDLSKTYRRMRYVQQYGKYQRMQADEITRKHKQVVAKQQELKEVRTAKQGLLKERTAEQTKLEEQEKKQRTLVTQLQKKQRTLQQTLTRKRREADKLNAQIDRLVEAEIAAARKRAAAEARKKAKNGKASSADKSTAASSSTTGKAAPMEAYRTDTEDRKLSANFESNRGQLPVPITGAYLIVSRYGTHEVAGLKHVKLDNKGVDIKGREGAQARAIFNGEVSAIFRYNGMTNVLVRHGSYISVYCNLSETTVKKGQRVNTRDPLGPVAKDASGNYILHFQLRRETAKLNPEVWMRH